MPPARRPTVRCLEDDLRLSLPPLTGSIAAALATAKATPRRQLAIDFCADHDAVHQGKRISSVSEVARVPVFRRRHSDLRGLTWYDEHALSLLPRGRVPEDVLKDGVEWLLLVDARADERVYHRGVKLAERGELLPGVLDEQRLLGELAAWIAAGIPDAARRLIDQALAERGSVIEAQLGWGIPSRVRISADASMEEIYVAIPRTVGALAERVSLALQAVLETASGLESDEVFDPNYWPPWVPSDWRCFHFVRPVDEIVAS